MAVRWPVPVFAAAGADRWGEVQELRTRIDLRLVTSPRHAAVLLVAGTIPSAHVEALRRVHDQVPHPRGAVMWDTSSTMLTGRVRTVERDADDGSGASIAEAVRSAWREVADDPARSRPDELVDQEAHEWRGVGPFGQGGDGMMGGTPYGRPMAMTADDRDGLSLDQLRIRFGPFLDALPGGVVIDVVLQGEVIQHAEIAVDAAGRVPRGAPGRAALQWLAHALHGLGLDAHAARAAGLSVVLARGGDRDAIRSDFDALRRSLRWTGLRGSLRSVGVIDGSDAWGRWSAQLDRIAADLSGRGGSVHDDAMPLAMIGQSLAGKTWADAVMTLTSLDPITWSVDDRADS